MLEDSHIPVLLQGVSNQCLFEVNTRDPRLNLGPVSFVSSFELESDLDMCLNLNLNFETSSNEFELDFSLPNNRLNDFVASTNKLNVLPEKIDYLELLSFQTHVNSNPIQQSIAEFSTSVEDDQDIGAMHFMPEMRQISDNIVDIPIADDVVKEPKIQRNLGLLSGFFQYSCQWTQLIKELFVDVKSRRSGFKPQENIQSTLLMDLFKVIIRETVLPGKI